MDLTTALSTAGIVVAAMLSTLGVVYTARAASGAQRRTAELQQNKIDAEAWGAQVDSWRSDVSALRQQRMEDLVAARADIKNQAAELEKLRARLITLEAELARDRLYIEALTAWGNAVVTLLRQANMGYPPVPPPLDDQGYLWHQPPEGS